MTVSRSCVFFWSGVSDGVPDVRMVWLFRKRLMSVRAIERLFDYFDATLRKSAIGSRIKHVVADQKS